MMRKLLVLLVCLVGAGALCLLTPANAHADYYAYPCNYPFVGASADVQVLVHGGGQYCDGPMEINGSHYECRSGGGGLGGGAIGLAPIGGGILDIGGFGGSGIGMNLGDCHFRCPDGEIAPPPNPPAAWTKHLVVNPAYNDCREHMEPQGPDSVPQAPESGPPAPNEPAGSPLTPGNPLPGG